MARRSDHSREELYAMALDAAGKIVEADGHGRLTARKVAHAIGYAPGTLYNLFRNRDEMILHLNGRTLDRLCRVLQAGETTGVAERDVETLVAAYVDFLQAHGGLCNLLFEFNLPAGSGLPAWYGAKVEKLLGFLEAAMAPLFGSTQSQELTQDLAQELAQAARVLWAGLHGICSLASSGKLMVVSDRTVKQMTASLVRHYLAGLRAEQGKD